LDELRAIERMKHGEIGGLAVLVRLYEVQAVRTAYLITRDHALAEDVVQNAFLRAYQRIDQFDLARPFGPWFMRSVVNAAIQAAHRQERELSLDAAVLDGPGDLTFADLLPDAAPNPDDQVERAELRQAVWDALGKLTPDQRAAVIQRYYLDMSDEEMAERMAIKPGTVRWRLHAARQRLRALLARHVRECHAPHGQEAE